MTEPNANSGQSTRLAAFVLLGVAVVAIGLGVFTLVNGPAPKPAATTAASASTPSGNPVGIRAGVPSTSATSGNPSTGPGPSSVSAAAGPLPGDQAAVAVRVYNNGTTKGLATCAANDFRRAGFNVVEVGNYSQAQGVISTSSVYYSAAPGEQQLAEQLGQQFSMRVDSRFAGIAFASPGVIVIVTNDFKGVC